MPTTALKEQLAIIREEFHGKLLEIEYSRIKDAREKSLWLRIVAVVILIGFYRVADFIFGREWDRIEDALAAVVCIVVPVIWRWRDQQEAVNEIRDKRNIRIELILKSLLNMQDDANEMLRKIDSE